MLIAVDRPVFEMVTVARTRVDRARKLAASRSVPTSTGVAACPLKKSRPRSKKGMLMVDAGAHAPGKKAFHHVSRLAAKIGEREGLGRRARGLGSRRGSLALDSGGSAGECCGPGSWERQLVQLGECLV